MKRLNEIQKSLKVPKGQENKFGGFHYRSCEDILEAVKPFLGFSTLTISDEIVQIGERYYVKATAMLKDGEEVETATGYAREVGEKTKMDEAQITGAASSYARKYALCGLLLIDDGRDADSDAPVAPKASQSATNTSLKGGVPWQEPTKAEKDAIILQEQKKMIILKLNAKVVNPMTTKAEFGAACLAWTGLELTDANVPQIIAKLI